jgi:hypothetical protein
MVLSKSSDEEGSRTPSPSRVFLTAVSLIDLLFAVLLVFAYIAGSGEWLGYALRKVLPVALLFNAFAVSTYFLIRPVNSLSMLRRALWRNPLTCVVILIEALVLILCFAGFGVYCYLEK